MKRLFAIAFVLMLCICAFAEEALSQSIGLTSVGNARELGGYQTADGRTVKRGVFLRTAKLSEAAEADIQRLCEDYRMSVVLDLRTTDEIEAEPDPEIPGVRNLHLGVMDETLFEEKGEGSAREDDEDFEASDKIDRIIIAIREGLVTDQMYVEFLSGEAGKAAYAQMFREIIDLPEGEALLFHCSQGKDRTGCAAMLILSALGVDEGTILEDFILTNSFNAELIDSERRMLEERGYEGDELEKLMTAMDAVNPRYMLNALDWMKENYGSALGYITQELGVSEAEIEQLRNKYLEGEIENTDAAWQTDTAVAIGYADKLFDNSYVHRIDVQLADADWTGLLADPISKTKVAADIVIDGEAFSNVTFSTKGFSSLYFVAYGEEESRRYSFKINFGKRAEGQTYYGLDKLSLNSLFCDNTWMKDLISYRQFRDAGVEAPLVSYVWLTVNGTDQGLYMAVEDINEGFLNRVYRGKGVIYSVERTIDTSNITRESMNWIRENGFPPATDVHGADLLYTGEDLANYADILDNAETKANPSDPGRIVSAIRALSREENVDDFFDMDEIIRFFAAHNVLLNFDSYTGSQLSNLKLHEQDGRLSLIPWDYNLAFGTFPSVIGFDNWEDPTRLMNLGIDTPLINAEEDSRPLWKLIRSHPEYLSAYHEVLDALLSDYLLNGEYEAEIDRVGEMLLPWVEKDPTAFCTVDEFQTARETLKSFLAIRTESIRRQLAGELSTVSEEQEKQDMVDASDLDLQSLGALVVGKLPG